MLVNAYDANIGGIYYNFSGNEATVTYREDGLFNSYSKSVVIPEHVTHNGKTYSVTSIGYYAFHSCSGLTSVTIPNSVTSIGSSAFYGCNSLSSITIPECVTSISYSTFRGCSGLTSITIPDGVITIGGSAFKYCTSLTSVTIPESVTSIGNDAFSNCSSLTSINIPSGVTSIGEYTFSNCSSLTSITIPFGVTSIGRYVFEKCSGLTEVYCCAVNVPRTESSSFNNSSIATATLYVPPTSVASYKSASPWNGFGEILPMNSHNLVYIVDGQVYKTLAVAFGDAITPEPAPTKEGHTFSGWSEIPETMPDHDVTVTGTFAINSYKLTYKVDGVTYKTSTVVYGTAINPEPAPTKEGYTFSGWNGLPATMPAHDVTVTGTFAINSYKLTYLIDGVVYKASTIVYGTTITPEPAPTKEGYNFSGWSEIPRTMPAHDVTVTGSFTPKNYILTYIVDGQEYKSLTVAYGSAIIPESAPSKEGHTFSGWSGLPATMPAHDVVVTGTFAINSYKLTYKVDGKVYMTLTIIYGTVITPEAEPVKEGYTFSGWSEIPETMPASDVVVTGSFSINSYILAYLVDGKEYLTLTLDYGTAITPEDEPTREGYTFSGWSDIPTTMPASDVTVTGTFTINQYILSYILDGKEYKSYSVDYNSAIIPESVPVKKGMTFSGWGEVPETMPAHDVTLSGSYSWSKETLDGVTYQVTDTLSNYASVIGYDNISGDAEILPTIETGGDTYTVNIIVNNAFKGCTGLTSITISGNVTSIGSYAFSGCSSLSSVTIGKGVTSIGNNAFYNTSPKKVFWLPNTPPNGYQNLVGAVNYVANDRYSYLTNVVVYPYLSSMFEVDDVKYVPVSPSERTCDAIDCSYSIENLNIGETVTNKGITLTIKNIGPYFCYDNTFVKEATISNQGSVGTYAFKNCAALQAVELGQGITSINNSAFANCTSITEIQIPKKVTTIEDYVFSGCTSLKTIHVDISRYALNLGSNGRNPLFADCPLDSVYIGRDITYPTTSNKGYSPFYRNTTLRLLTIADNETDISAYEFYGCTNLESVRIGDGMTSIGDRAFSGCSSLEYFAFGFNVRTIGKEVFSDCTALSRLISRAIIPPTCGAQALDDINKWECTLIVPQDHIAAYQQADQWKEFFFIEGGDFDDSIGEVKAEIATGEDWYDLNGRKLAAPQKSINIIRYSDGSSRKVLLK